MASIVVELEQQLVAAAVGKLLAAVAPNPETFHKTALVLLPPHLASLHTSQPHQVRLLMLAAALLIAAVTAVPAVPAQSHHRKEVYLGVAIIDRMD